MAKSTALFVGRQSLGGENASKIADFDDAFASLVGCNVASFGVFPLLGFASNLRSVLTPNDDYAVGIAANYVAWTHELAAKDYRLVDAAQ